MTTLRKPAASAIADLDEGTVLARVDINVPRERVWRAITTDELTKWWGSPEMYQTTAFAMDLRPGGAWRSEGRGADGSTFHVEGEIVKAEPPSVLVHTWKPSWEPGPATVVSYRLDELDEGKATRVTVRHTGFANPKACDDHANGWVRVLGWLSGYVQPPASDDKYFLCRLLSPRPSFPQDMNAEERTAMTAHAAYYRSKLATGDVLVFGPVGDPAGAWGMGLVRAKDEAGVRAFTEADPALKIGLRYEILPMLATVF